MGCQPEIQADSLTVLGRVYRRLGAFDKAERLLERALAVGRTVYGAEHVRIAKTLNDLGVLLTDKGDYAAAARSLEDKVFPEYLRQIRTLHPDESIPALFADHAVFDNARMLRERLGVEVSLHDRDRRPERP